MHIHIPFYESLTIEKFLAFAKECKGGIALQYLPDNKLDMDKLPRQFIANVIYTLLEDDFSDWVSTQIEFHNKQQAITGNKMIELDADIAEIFHMSTSTSGKPSSLSMILSNFSIFLLNTA